MPPPAHQAAPALIVIAKAPLPGSVKTRLCPPLDPLEASLIAEAALADTLETVAATPAHRRVLVLDGEPGSWLPAGIEVIPQRGGNLAERLRDAFADVGEAALLIGMDTPQVTRGLLSAGLRLLVAPDCDAVIGLTEDGGYWAIGLCEPDARVFERVPMSSSGTGAFQLRRLRGLGLRTVALPRLRDIDHYDDALAVASGAPHTRLAAVLRSVSGAPLGTVV